MIKDEWLNKCNDPRLKYLFDNYHPVNRQPGRRSKDFITAPNAEIACSNLIKDIRKNSEGNPYEHFQRVIQEKDISTAMRLLNECWIGVPESTSCWSIEGFKEAVSLLEDEIDE